MAALTEATPVAEIRPGQHYESRRRSIAACYAHDGSVLHELGRVRLVADAARREGRIERKTRPFEDPMLRKIAKIGIALRLPSEGPLAIADAGHGVFRSIDRRGVPLDRHPAVVDAGKGVLDRVPVADQSAVAVLEARLPPAHISTEESDIAALRNEGFDIVSHFLRPVFVMPAADQELVVGEQRRVGV